MITTNFLRGRRRRELSQHEKAVLEASVSEVRRLPRRTTIVRQGQPVENSTLLLEGVMLRYMDDREGHRQVVAIHIAGDFVDLHGYPLAWLDHDVATASACRVALVPHRNLEAITHQEPHLARLLWFSTLLDAAMHREWIFRIGRLGAAGRIAHLFCELNVRLGAIGLSNGRSYRLALTQIDLGEACGLTSIHVNRTLRVLREDGLVTFEKGQVTIQDWDRLRRLAEFDPAYLYLSDAA
ncbi:Crp/Fnr family transcriptional regulator [Sphingomonas sp. 1P06PA]|uniref:Crp/Fnr family transcriptional regulator n=1 Tax=Sphingomonas sp. 1P06PA TaxID=554121 RepID=UPI0039A4892C